MKLKLSELFATVFYIGKAPLAPGTVGSLAAFAAWYYIYPWIGLPFLISVTIIITILGVITSSIIEGSTQESDPSRIVIDEWAGQWIAFWFIPHTLWYGIAAFILFRLFDIWKPGPIRKLDQLSNGWGVMMDDIAAGLAAGVILFIYQVAAG